MTDKERKELIRDIGKKQRSEEEWVRFRHTFLTVVVTLLIVLTAVISYKISAKIHSKGEPDIDVAFVSAKLQDISELSTAELEYTGLLTYSDGKIPFITQTGFSMIYTADVKAGVDLADMTIDVTEKQVIVNLPKTKVFTVYVDTDSIDFYDEKHALFNWGSKYDVTEAISAAEEDVKQKVDTYELMAKADEQAKLVIEQILEGSIGDRELVVNFDDNQEIK